MLICLLWSIPLSAGKRRITSNGLYDVFSNHATYKDKVRRWDYCVTKTYADDFKIDITPCIKGSVLPGYEICNRNTNAFVRSEPIQYTEWLIGKNDLSKANAFRKVTRIFKYMRDIKGNFTCPSMLLTTLLGYRMSSLDPFGSEFDDVPTEARQELRVHFSEQEFGEWRGCAEQDGRGQSHRTPGQR